MLAPALAFGYRSAVDAMGFSITNKFLDFVLLTGAEWVMWLLIALSVLSVYVMIERAMFYRSASGAETEIRRKLFAALTDRDFELARGLTRDTQAPSARIISEMVEVADKGKTALKAAMEAGRAEEKVRLERNLSVLGTLGANAPFIGLFGTVIGIIVAFDKLGAAGAKPTPEQSAAVMDGIAEALVATAVGLIVAIPAVVAYNVYQRRVKRTLAHAETIATSALALLLDSENSSADEEA